MRIHIDTLQNEPRSIEIDGGMAWARESAASVVDCPIKTMNGRLELLATGKQIRVTGRLQLRLEGVCGRCGEEVDLTVSVVPALSYEPFPDESKGGEVELERKDLDIGWYHGDEIDLRDVLCEVITLAMPPRIVCADVEACDIRTRALLGKVESGSTTLSGFAALKDFS